MEPAKDCTKLKMIEDFVRLHTAECFVNIGAVLMAATPPKRGATAADGTIDQEAAHQPLHGRAAVHRRV